jgi:predicted methyltransferase
MKNKFSKYAFGLTATLVAATLLGCSGTAESMVNKTKQKASASASSSMITAAVANPLRGDDAKRDQYRNPQETLEFFGLQPDMTVVEIWPGGGWYSEILNPVLMKEGQLVGAHFHPYEGANAFYGRSLEKYKEKVSSDPLYKNIKVTEFHPTKAQNIAAEGSADMVLTFRNVHNWYMADADNGVTEAFKVFHKALKKGGVLGVVEHRMPENFDQVKNKRSGYMQQSYVIAAAEKAGFELVATSEINANPKDTADHPKGVWTLPPRLANDDVDRDKYMAIGESDRMTLKFVKK